MKNPVEFLNEKDSAHHEHIMNYNKFVFSDGALTTKDKLLIALAIDAALRADSGVKSLALMAKKAGATKEEILEAVRVAGYVGSVSSVFSAMCGLEEVL